MVAMGNDTNGKWHNCNILPNGFFWILLIFNNFYICCPIFSTIWAVQPPVLALQLFLLAQFWFQWNEGLCLMGNTMLWDFSGWECFKFKCDTCFLVQNLLLSPLVQGKTLKKNCFALKTAFFSFHQKNKKVKKWSDFQDLDSFRISTSSWIWKCAILIFLSKIHWLWLFSNVHFQNFT